MRNEQDFRVSRRKSLRWLIMTAAGFTLASCSNSTSSGQVPEQAETSEGQATVQIPPTAIIDHTEQVTQQQPATQQPSSSQPDQATQVPSGQAYLSVVRGIDPATITEAAIRALGGMERFVKNGFDVIIKPNICTDYHTFEYAATTNPVVVATLVKLVFGAGAKRVRVMDFPFGGTPASAYARSGIEEAVKEAGGEMEVMNPNKFVKTNIPQGISIKEWEIYQDVMACDLLIDVPIAKDHSLARLTLGGKNLLGVIQRRSMIHSDLGQRVADLISVVRPGLTVVDAVRTLMNHGPTGGNLDDVKMTNTIIASHDIVAADSYATGLFNLTGNDISYIRKSAEMGLGTLDLSSIKIEEISL